MKNYFIFLISLFSVIISAQTVNADVFEINYQTSLNANNLFNYKDKILFTGENVNGKHNAIWAYDKPSKKSYRIKEIETGWSSLSVSKFSSLKEKVYFTIVNSPNNELWVTDATTEGTYKVFEFPESTYVYKMESFGNHILAITTGKGLYISDGTPAGTKIIQGITGEIAPGINYYNGYIIFGAKNANFSNEMWASDGTDTFRILDAETNGILFIHTDAYEYLLGDKMIFYGRTANGAKDGIWQLNLETKKANYISDAKNFADGIVLNNKLIYKAWDSQFGGRIWVSDGTSQNTFPLNNQNQFVAAMSNQNFLMKNGNSVYFFPRIGNWDRLWKTDGTTEGTVATDIVIDNSGPDFEKSFLINKKLVIRNSTYDKYWLLDEAENLTLLPNKLDDAVEESGKVIFPYTNKKYGNELFQYDFDSNAISLFHDGNHSAGSNPKNFEKTSDGKLIFTAGNTESGNEFYLLENKNSLPQLIKDFDYNGDYSYGIPDGKLFKVGNYYYQKPSSFSKVLARTDGSSENTNLLYFTGNDQLYYDSSFGNLNDNTLVIVTYASENDGRYLKVWKVDNNNNVISLITKIPTSSTIHNGKDGVFYNGYLYFTVGTPDYKTQIWRTDGTSENTTLVPFIIPDAEYYNNTPQLLTVFDNKLLISKNYGLWFYDDFAKEVKEITIPSDDYPFTTQFNISNKPEVIDGKLYLLSQNGYGSLYRFDNMQDSPVALISENMMGPFSKFQKCGNQIFFASGNIENRYNAFWSLDPVKNTNNVIFMNNYSGTDRVKDLTCVNNYMYYSNESNNKILRTNGTQQSITTIDVILDNANQMEATDTLDDMFSFDGHLYFVATTKESGKELFHIKTDLPAFLSINDNQNLKKSTITISPNPTSGLIKVYAKSNINKVEVYDYSGVKIAESQSDNLDFSKLNVGVYLIKIYTKDSVETKKVIKK